MIRKPKEVKPKIKKQEISDVLSTNQDWFIEIKDKKNGRKVVINNYYSATHNTPRIARNYPIKGKDGWLSYDDIINNYEFVKSWTPDDMVDHIQRHRNSYINKKIPN